MTGPTREQVWSAVFALLDGNVPGIQYYSRAAKQIPDLATANPPIPQPALFLRELDEKTEHVGRGAPAKRTWHGAVIVYATVPDKATPGATIVNPILDGIEVALAPAGADVAFNAVTLGSSVSYVAIHGDTIKETGDTDPNGQALLVVPIKVVVP